jgi:hypothetical protein
VLLLHQALFLLIFMKAKELYLEAQCLCRHLTMSLLKLHFLVIVQSSLWHCLRSWLSLSLCLVSTNLWGMPHLMNVEMYVVCRVCKLLMFVLDLFSLLCSLHIPTMQLWISLFHNISPFPEGILISMVCIRCFAVHCECPLHISLDRFFINNVLVSHLSLILMCMSVSHCHLSI